MAQTATKSFTHQGGWARVAWRRPCRRREHHGADGRGPGDLAAGRRRRRWPPRPHRHRPPGAGSNPRARRAGWPVAPPGPGSRTPARGATARARRRPASRRSATGRGDRPAALTGTEHDRRAALEQAAPRSPGRRSATRSASSRSGGRSTVMVTASAAGRSSSRTITFPACAVERQWTRRRLSPARRGGRRGESRSARGRSRASPAPSSAGGRGSCAAAARRDVQRCRQAERDPLGPPLQGERRRRGHVERDRIVDAAAERGPG